MYDISDPVQSTPLQVALVTAVRSGDVREVKKALENGACVNARDGTGKTALIWACQPGMKLGVVKLLKSFGADLEKSSSTSGCTPLSYACRYNYPEIVRWLLSNGANKNAVSSMGWTPLMYACCCGHVKVVQAISRRTSGSPICNLEHTDHSGNTALILAAKQGHVEVISSLLRRGADREAKNHQGKTAARCATDAQKPNAADVLRHCNYRVSQSRASSSTTRRHALPPTSTPPASNRPAAGSPGPAVLTEATAQQQQQLHAQPQAHEQHLGALAAVGDDDASRLAEQSQQYAQLAQRMQEQEYAQREFPHSQQTIGQAAQQTALPSWQEQQQPGQQLIQQIASTFSTLGVAEGQATSTDVDDPMDIDVSGDEHTDNADSDRQDGIRGGRSNAVAGAQSAGATEVVKCIICEDAPVSAGLKHGYSVHYEYCQDCVRSLQRHGISSCPDCRQPIDGVIYTIFH